MRWLALALASPLLLAGSASAGATAQPSWKTLRRPLHLPRVAPGAPCPVSPLRNVRLKRGEVRPLVGAGPAYPILNGRYLDFFWPTLPSQVDFDGTGWSGNKVMWVIAAGYRGRVLVRGRQVDGTHELRFDTGLTHERKLFGSTGVDPVRRYPGYTRVQAPGCYAYQVDGAAISRVIVFEARIVTPPKHDPPPP